MQSLPASHPFPVAGIALVAHHELRSAFRFMMRHQRREHRRDFRVMRFAFIFRFRHREAFLDEARIVLSAHEAMTVHHGLVERDVRPHADDAIFFQRAAHSQNGLAARLAPDHQLGDHRIVEGRDLDPRIDAGIHPHARSGGDDAECNPSCGRHESVIGVFGVDAAFDGVSA